MKISLSQVPEAQAENNISSSSSKVEDSAFLSTVPHGPATRGVNNPAHPASHFADNNMRFVLTTPLVSPHSAITQKSISASVDRLCLQLEVSLSEPGSTLNTISSLEQRLIQDGATPEEFSGFLMRNNARFLSATTHTVTHQPFGIWRDFAGILLLPVEDGKYHVMERLQISHGIVILSDHTRQPLYFVTSYGSSIVSFSALEKIIRAAKPFFKKARAGVLPGMRSASTATGEQIDQAGLSRTRFRMALQRASEKATLAARTSLNSSTSAILQRQMNPAPISLETGAISLQAARAMLEASNGVGPDNPAGKPEFCYFFDPVSTRFALFRRHPYLVSTGTQNAVAMQEDLVFNGYDITPISEVTGVTQLRLEVLEKPDYSDATKALRKSKKSLLFNAFPKLEKTLTKAAAFSSQIELDMEDGTIHRLLFDRRGVQMQQLSDSSLMSSPGSMKPRQILREIFNMDAQKGRDFLQSSSDDRPVIDVYSLRCVPQIEGIPESVEEASDYFSPVCPQMQSETLPESTSVPFPSIPGNCNRSSELMLMTGQSINVNRIQDHEIQLDGNAQKQMHAETGIFVEGYSAAMKATLRHALSSLVGVLPELLPDKAQLPGAIQLLCADICQLSFAFSFGQLLDNPRAGPVLLKRLVKDTLLPEIPMLAVAVSKAISIDRGLLQLPGFSLSSFQETQLLAIYRTILYRSSVDFGQLNATELRDEIDFNFRIRPFARFLHDVILYPLSEKTIGASELNALMKNYAVQVLKYRPPVLYQQAMLKPSGENLTPGFSDDWINSMKALSPALNAELDRLEQSIDDRVNIRIGAYTSNVRSGLPDTHEPLWNVESSSCVGANTTYFQQTRNDGLITWLKHNPPAHPFTSNMALPVPAPERLPLFDSLSLPEWPTVQNAFSRSIVENIRKSQRLYALDNAPFHHLLSDSASGRPIREEIVPGITVTRDVLNYPAAYQNSETTQDDIFFDPIQLLYCHLGSTPELSGSTACILPRHTVDLDSRELDNFEDISQLKVGNIVALSSLDAKVGATDLSAAERYTPGVLMKISSVDNIANGSGKKKVRSKMALSYLKRKSVAFMAAPILRISMDLLDTWEMEQSYFRFKRNELGAQDDGCIMLRPASGCLMTYHAATNTIHSVTAVRHFPSCTPFDSDYVTYARWRYPFSGNTAPRMLKDAILAAIWRRDPIVPYLDQAIRNNTHELLRQLNGYPSSPSGRDEQKVVDATRKYAAHIATRFPDTIDMPLSPDGHLFAELLAWTASILLRIPVSLTLVKKTDADGAQVAAYASDASITFTTTFDHIDLSTSPMSMIGIDDHFYYAIRHENDQMIAMKIEAEGVGHTAGNLLHALNYARFAEKKHYRVRMGSQRDIALTASSTARTTVHKLLLFLKNFVSNATYYPWQRALTEKFDDIEIHEGLSALNKLALANESERLNALSDKRTTRKSRSRSSSLSNTETRQWYINKDAAIAHRIEPLNDLRDKAKHAFMLRNSNRDVARNRMLDRELAVHLIKNEPNRTWDELYLSKRRALRHNFLGNPEGLERAVYHSLIAGSQRTRASVNDELNIAGPTNDGESSSSSESLSSRKQVYTA